jgi:NAD(P)-dependent dehydrogenase (short-subunit alcohol dehydrogenase family)
MQLKDHIVLVTGALGTLGSAMCSAIAASGGKAIASDLASRGAVDIALDVTKEDEWIAAMKHIAREHGRLDGLVNNAGVGNANDVEQTSYAEWRRVMAVNADGVFLGCKYAMPLLAQSKAPSIVNISSASGIVGGANLAAYNASKGAVRMLSKSVALAGARKRPQVRCNSVQHAFIEGDMVAAIRAPPQSFQAMAKLHAQIPMAAWGGPELADRRLAAVQASSFTTTELLVDGGLIAGEATPQWEANARPSMD